jgi:FixJ family two-component response regulator
MVARSCGAPEKRFVVIVEDDAAVCGALAFALRTHEIPVRCYDCAEDLLADGSVGDVCYMIVDYQLPKMNGLDLLAELKTRGVHAPAAIIATNPSAAVRAAAAVHGAAMVEKPLLDEELYDLVLSSRERLSSRPRET